MKRLILCLCLFVVPANAAEAPPQSSLQEQLIGFYDRATVAFTRMGDPADATAAQQLKDIVKQQMRPQPTAPQPAPQKPSH